MKNRESQSHSTGSGRSKACLSVVGRVIISVLQFTALIWAFHLKCHMVCLSVILLCYRITCLWLCNKRLYNKKGVLFVLDPVVWEVRSLECLQLKNNWCWIMSQETEIHSTSMRKVQPPLGVWLEWTISDIPLWMKFLTRKININRGVTL